MAIIEIVCIFIGFSAGVIIEWLCFMSREQKLKSRIRHLELLIARNNLVSAITTPIVSEFAKEICKSVFGGRKK